jgi:hypothetical protein
VQRLVWEYVTKGGAVIVQYVPEGVTPEQAAARASSWLEIPDQVRDEETGTVKPAVLEFGTVTGGHASVRLDRIDHIATDWINADDVTTTGVPDGE